MSKLRQVSTVTIGLLTLFWATGCDTQSSSDTSSGYPTQDVRVIVPYAAGGPTDTAARVISECLSDELDSQFLVENKPGGAASVGMSIVLSSEPDGYTLFPTSSSVMSVTPLISDAVSYKLSDIEVIGEIYEVPSLLLVRDDSKYESADQLLTTAKQKPKTVTIASPGSSTIHHLALQRMAEVYGIEFRIVPFEGSAPARTALLGGNVDALFGVGGESILQLIDSNKVRALATGSPERIDYLNQVPTFADLGYEEISQVSSIWGLGGRAGMPEQVVATLRKGMASCLKQEAVIERLGQRHVPNEFVGGDELSDFYQSLLDAHKSVL